MPLSKDEVQELLRQVDLTREQEINCDECLAQVAEFAEHEVSERAIPDALDAVEHHLSVCAECREEYQALRRALKHIGD